MASWDGVALTRALGGVCCLAMALGACTVVVGGVLDGKGVDGGATSDMTLADLGAPDLPSSGRCTDDPQCRNTNACDGVERCTDGLCFAGTPVADGSSCDADFNAATRDLCLAARCVASLCGDGFADAPGEACDDGNTNDGDGCDADCTGSCAVDADCDDRNPCTLDQCQGDLTCKNPPAAPGSGVTCGVDGICIDGLCVPAGCGDGVVVGAEECDPPDGAACTPTCQFQCEADGECDDGDVCNGTPTCIVATHTCTPAVALDCVDANGCTVDTCSPLSGCKNALQDGDGYGPASCGGADCNDADLNVNPGAPEACNGADDDCDGVADDGTMIIDWYIDSDGDGFGDRSTSMSSCERPAGFVANADDCYDANANAHPYLRGSAPDFGADRGDRSYDYDCDGVETPQYGAPSCRDGGAHFCTGTSCTGTSGVDASTACGDRTSLLACAQCRAVLGLRCGAAATTSVIQGCH